MGDQTRERDLVLAQNQYAFILDGTKGNVNVIVGPNKSNLSVTDQPVIFSTSEKKFKSAQLEESIKEFPSAAEGEYIVLENPSKTTDEEHPNLGTSNIPLKLKLDFGRKTNIPGPISFPLWPGQVATIIPGHHLRSNQYLVVRVYNEKLAKENWQQSVIAPQTPTQPLNQPPDGNDEATNVNINVSGDVVPSLTMGKLFVIKGTDVSFFIPPTGVEVVRDNFGEFVRDAVTLERLEYCILLDENGNKRYVQGPAVVFPSPTETFIEKDNSRKFRATELNEDMGIHIKVIADYSEGNQEYKVGDELFITGKQQRIYFPRQEHAIIKYGDQEIYYAVAIPEGEARYVLEKNTGKVLLVKGPKMFLPDPRSEVMVRRIIDLKTVRLWYPGNDEAVKYNEQLFTLASSSDIVDEKNFQKAYKKGSSGIFFQSIVEESVSRGMVADDFKRNEKYTPPRTITLNTKYDGVPNISPWTGYAVRVIKKTGERKTIVGPQTVLLEYDETLESLSLSTGKPKNTDKLEQTVYLRIKQNQVSDIVQVVTKDMVKVDVKLSYRVNFEGEPDKWFNVENYVKFLTDHIRSMLKNAVKQYGIEQFNDDGINIVRNTVLGVPTEDSSRTGRSFEENGMKIYDVEVLDIKIGDAEIDKLLVGFQHDAVQKAITVAKKEKELEIVQRTENIDRKIAEEKTQTEISRLNLEVQKVQKQLAVSLERLTANIEEEKKKLAVQKAENEVAEAELEIAKEGAEQEINLANQRQNQVLTQLKAEVEAAVEKMKAISPDLVSALQSFSDRSLAEKVATALAPLGVLTNQSVGSVYEQLLKGTILQNVLNGKTPIGPMNVSSTQTE